MIECTINGQSAALNLSNQQLQVLISGKFGDGCLTTPKTCVDNSIYMTNCKYKEYIEYKGKTYEFEANFKLQKEFRKEYQKAIKDYYEAYDLKFGKEKLDKFKELLTSIETTIKVI